jgi:formylglycine-generating enzyme required for sulfatase activity
VGRIEPLLLAAALMASPALAGTASASPRTDRMRYVVVPLIPEVEATPKEAKRTTRMLGEALQRLRRVRVVRAEPGSLPKGPCDADCLLRVAKASKADRAVGGTLIMQPKVYYPGVHWHITLTQVDVQQGGVHGTYERVYVASGCRKRFVDAAALALRDADPAARLPPVAPPPAPKPGVNVPPKMAHVPAGDFVMGSDIGEENDGPRHLVWLDAYNIDLFETSNAEHKECVAAGACTRSRFHDDADLGRDGFPVAGVNFKDAETYCEWRKKRLPTEAEWERAARGTDERRWPWGNEFDPKKVNMRHAEDGWVSAAPVDAMPEGRSPVGAHHMAGNVWEWTSDWNSHSYYRKSPRRNPRGPNGPRPRRSIRGGSWRYDIPYYVSSYNRSNGRPGSRFTHLGIRCAMDAE